ncbi:hypothetical protein Zmor_015049 [Zophobas morio]|uniref:Regulatory protein zeste n=1 Tax=Zophobas morio TaxID=2755281 RepID=A0AA38MGT0_9CUCU|nr:hypothetical protein Zmor_015049 [Zophobas morio]
MFLHKLNKTQQEKNRLELATRLQANSGSGWRNDEKYKEEELLLLEEIYKYRGILENKTTNNVTASEKNEKWNEVFKAFNSKNNQHRSLDQLKSKFDNLKTKTRKWAATQKSHPKKTGGGPPLDSPKDPVLEAVLAIVNIKTVVGLSSIGDDDFVPDSIADVHLEEVHDGISLPMTYELDILNGINAQIDPFIRHSTRPRQTIHLELHSGRIQKARDEDFEQLGLDEKARACLFFDG